MSNSHPSQPLASRVVPSLARVLVTCGLLLVVAATTGCEEELLPQEPRGAYLLFRQAIFQGDADQVWAYLDKDTKDLFDQRYGTLLAMSDQIVQFLPSVDQKLARQQTGVVMLGDQGIHSGQELFNAVFKPKAVEITPEIEVGTEVSEVEVNEAESEAVVVTYAGTVYRLVVEEDGIWRISNWRELVATRTAWVDGNQTALEQTVSDLINEEKEGVDKIIKFILAEEEKRAARNK